MLKGELLSWEMVTRLVTQGLGLGQVSLFVVLAMIPKKKGRIVNTEQAHEVKSGDCQCRRGDCILDTIRDRSF